VALLRTREALIGLRDYFEEHLPDAVEELGAKSRIQVWTLGRFDPEALLRYDTLLIATIPERIGPIGDERTVVIPIDVYFGVQASEEEDVLELEIAYGDAVINLWNEDPTFGGAVFGSTAHNPEISMPAPGSKGIGCTFVRLNIELNLLGG
jgi:hypothetical protein